MDRQPLISICIPAYKRIEYVQRLLDSISAQSFRDFEVVLSDDSPDDSIERLVMTYQDRFPLLYSHNRPALGTPGNWNGSIALARGQWIKLMHDDDWFASENSLGVFAEAIGTAVPGDLIFSAYSNSYLPGDRQTTVLLRPSGLKALRRNPASLFARNSIGPPSVTLYRRREGLSYDTRLKWLVDIDFYIRCLATGVPRYIPEPLVNIGVGNEQVTRAVFRQRNVEIPESFIVLDKMGTAALRSLIVYDAWWRLMRNLEIRRTEELTEAGHAGPIPAAIASMIRWQRRVPGVLLRAGPFSKSIMFLHYLLHRNNLS